MRAADFCNAISLIYDFVIWFCQIKIKYLGPFSFENIQSAYKIIVIVKFNDLFMKWHPSMAFFTVPWLMHRFKK